MPGSVKGRFAPSPTGFIHIGNAWSFLLTWLYVRKKRGKIILRIEDIDPVRSKNEFEIALIEDLQWLGLDWDELMFQSQRRHLYEEALTRLREKNLIYKCFCTRKELRQIASAPHAGEDRGSYRCACRNIPPEQILEKEKNHEAWNLRFKYPQNIIKFRDLAQDEQSFFPQAVGGDFSLKRSDGIFSYQLACAVDDGMEKINFVCRGQDLLPSAARQISLCNALNLPVPVYAHHPLIKDQQGERLAKRHAALSVRSLRAKDVKAKEIMGFLGLLAGCNPMGCEKKPSELLDDFSMSNLPKHDLQLPDNIAWLK